MRGATKVENQEPVSAEISIHAPHAGSDDVEQDDGLQL